MLSTSLFASNGTRYPQKDVFGSTFTLNQTALNEIGLPALTGKLLSSINPAQLIGSFRFQCMVQSDAELGYRRAHRSLCSLLGTVRRKIVQAGEDKNTARSSLAGTDEYTSQQYYMILYPDNTLCRLCRSTTKRRGTGMFVSWYLHSLLVSRTYSSRVDYMC